MPQRNKLTKLPLAPESEAPPHRASQASSVTTVSVQTQKELMKHKKPLQRTLKDNWVWIGDSGFNAL